MDGLGRMTGSTSARATAASWASGVSCGCGKIIKGHISKRDCHQGKRKSKRAVFFFVSSFSFNVFFLVSALCSNRGVLRSHRSAYGFLRRAPTKVPSPTAFLGEWGSTRRKSATCFAASRMQNSNEEPESPSLLSGKFSSSPEMGRGDSLSLNDESEVDKKSLCVRSLSDKRLYSGGIEASSRPSPSSTAGLLDRLRYTTQRQRCVTGRFPLHITVQENPTRKWWSQLSSSRATGSMSQILVNGTSVDRGLASYERFQWLDAEERDALHNRYALISLELIAEIFIKRPGYVNLLSAEGAGSSAAAHRAADVIAPKWINRWKRSSILLEQCEEGESSSQERLWITGFSLTNQKGFINCVDVDSGRMGSVNERSANGIKWPNEVNHVPYSKNHEMVGGENDIMHDDAILVSDGFLVPGRDAGGIYVVRNPGNAATEWRVSLTADRGEGWFYHRAIWVDLTGDGRQSILTARAKRPPILRSSSASVSPANSESGQLVWLERPKPHTYDKVTGTPLDVDGTIFDPFSSRNTPWKQRVLDTGPDVMFSLADLDPDDDTMEVIASQFFTRRLTLHSIQRGDEPKVVLRRTLDEKCGASFSAVLADLDCSPSFGGATNRGTVVDPGSTVTTLRLGEPFSHVLVTSHECAYANAAEETGKMSQPIRSSNGGDQSWSTVSTDTSAIDGGSLFAYRVPTSSRDAWKTEGWTRSVIATGFRVQGQLGNMINPGAPGFCYTFYPTRDGSEPKWQGAHASTQKWKKQRPLIAIAGDCAEAAYILRPMETTDNSRIDPSTKYALMCEIDCGATVGSLGIGYDDFCLNEQEQESGYAKIYIPCYEKDKVLVFAMGSGEEEVEEDDGW